MASNSQAALLDQLMGVDRNSARKHPILWDDERICKYYLAGFCPHELFVNTRMSLGVCSKIHDSNLLSKYKDSSSYLKVGYERKLQRFLQSFVKDIEIKIKYNEEKLLDEFKSGPMLTIKNRIQIMEEEINSLVNEIERLGNEGKISECQTLHLELEEKQKQFKYDKIELERQKTDSTDNQDVVCKICGAYTSKNDFKNSVENHISGKIHSGYVKINEVLEDLDNVLKEAREKSRERDDRRKKSSDRKGERNHSRRRSKESREYRKSNLDSHKKEEAYNQKHCRENEDRNFKSKRRSRSHERRHSEMKKHKSNHDDKHKSSKSRQSVRN